MGSLSLARVEKIKVSRTQLRQNQSRIFRRVSGRRVAEVTGWNEEDEKYVVDKRYFDNLLDKLRALAETLDITGDPKLLSQLLRAAETIDADARAGRLHSFEEAFGKV
jgi:hypothetical protein